MKKFVVVFLAIICVFLFGCGAKQEVIKKSASVLAHEMNVNTTAGIKVFDEMLRDDKTSSYVVAFNAALLRVEMERYYCDKYNGKELEVTGCVLFKSFCSDGALMMILGVEDNFFVRVYVMDEREIEKCVKFKSAYNVNGLAAFVAMIGKQSVAEGDYVKMRGKCKIGLKEAKERYFDIMNAKVVG